MTNSKYYVADVEKLQKAIDSTCTSKSQIASSGKMATDTLNKALKGKRVIKAKANGIVSGLKTHGCSPTLEFDDLFSPDVSD